MPLVLFIQCSRVVSSETLFIYNDPPRMFRSNLKNTQTKPVCSSLQVAVYRKQSLTSSSLPSRVTTACHSSGSCCHRYAPRLTKSLWLKGVSRNGSRSVVGCRQRTLVSGGSPAASFAVCSLPPRDGNATTTLCHLSLP